MGFITLNTLRRSIDGSPGTVAERVFSGDREAGAKFIDYLAKVRVRRDICLNAPTVEAWEAEVRLVEVLDHADELDRETLNGAVADYCNTHWLYRQTGRKWVRDIPVFFMRLVLGGETHDNITCNEIQVHIIAALWKSLHPEAEVRWERI